MLKAEHCRRQCAGGRGDTGVLGQRDFVQFRSRGADRRGHSPETLGCPTFPIPHPSHRSHVLGSALGSEDRYNRRLFVTVKACLHNRRRGWSCIAHSADERLEGREGDPPGSMRKGQGGHPARCTVPRVPTSPLCHTASDTEGGLRVSFSRLVRKHAAPFYLHFGFKRAHFEPDVCQTGVLAPPLAAAQPLARPFGLLSSVPSAGKQGWGLGDRELAAGFPEHVWEEARVGQGLAGLP